MAEHSALALARAARSPRGALSAHPLGGVLLPRMGAGDGPPPPDRRRGTGRWPCCSPAGCSSWCSSNTGLESWSARVALAGVLPDGAGDAGRSGRSPRRPGVARAGAWARLGRNSLGIYVTHLVLLYGWAGDARDSRRSLPPTLRSAWRWGWLPWSSPPPSRWPAGAPALRLAGDEHDAPGGSCPGRASAARAGLSRPRSAPHREPRARPAPATRWSPCSTSASPSSVPPQPSDCFSAWSQAARSARGERELLDDASLPCRPAPCARSAPPPAAAAPGTTGAAVGGRSSRTGSESRRAPRRRTGRGTYAGSAPGRRLLLAHCGARRGVAGGSAEVSSGAVGSPLAIVSA